MDVDGKTKTNKQTKTKQKKQQTNKSEKKLRARNVFHCKGNKPVK